MASAGSALVAVATTAQILAPGAYVEFATNAISKGMGIQHTTGSNSIGITVPGLYLVSVDADVLPTVAGSTTVALQNNGEAVPGAQATFTGVTATVTHISFTTIIRVRRSCDCIDNNALLQVVAVEGSTITNANITVVSVA